MFMVMLIGLSLWIAVSTTRRVAHYGASGMTAGMAAMMAAMGTGLTLGYAVGMRADLGWATLLGVLAGALHGLLMGRKFGPMAALDGAGGGVMGGLMGPMLGVMLLYLPASLLLTALLMLILQAAFSLGAVYLVAAANGAVGSTGLLHQVGRLLGSQYQAVECCPEEPVVRTPQPRPKEKKATTKGGVTVSKRQHRLLWTATGLIGGAGVVMLGASLLTLLPGFPSRAGTVPWPQESASGPAVVAPTGPDGVQQVALSLSYPRYEPELVQVKAGVPVRLTLQAMGDPG
jgi:hypothetical protein